METRLALVGILVIFNCVSAVASVGAQTLEERYWAELDRWVQLASERTARKLPPTGIQEMAQTCGKLVVLRADAAEIPRMTTTAAGREDFDFKVDVCVKLTVQRVAPQPEFENGEIRETICIKTNRKLFKDLCRRADLIPSGG